MGLVIASQHKERLAELPSSFYEGWRISLNQWKLSAEEKEELEILGERLYRFYQSCNLLYHHSLRDVAPTWIAEYLDLGKDPGILSIGRMNRFENSLPRVIRPDLIKTKDGFLACELDSVPGGIGLMAQFQEIYQTPAIIGGKDGMLQAFAQMIREEAPAPNVAIVITEEANGYRQEMEILAARLCQIGLPTSVVTPDDLEYRDEEVYYRSQRLDLLYRFFELYELPRMIRSDLLLKAVKKLKVKITPSLRPHLEEKMWFAFFHHPALRSFWREQLGEKTDLYLQKLFPRTWILDPRPMSPAGIIPGIEFRGNVLQDWRVLSNATQKERSRWVIKPSGYSPLAWGARGVRVGEDLSGHDWNHAIEEALANFTRGPWLLQEWGHPIRQSFEVISLDGVKEKKEVRGRISPFYFVTEGKAKLRGVLATLCSLDKKIIHGMPGAILAPAGSAGSRQE
jgi:hypothetical protein